MSVTHHEASQRTSPSDAATPGIVSSVLAMPNQEVRISALNGAPTMLTDPSHTPFRVRGDDQTSLNLPRHLPAAKVSVSPSFLAAAIVHRAVPLLLVGASSLVTSACGPPPVPRSAASPAAAALAMPAAAPDPAGAAPTADPMAWSHVLEQQVACNTHWTADCTALVARLRTDCPIPIPGPGGVKLCTMLADRLESVGARATCSEGSVAECAAACQKGGNGACVELAAMYRRGSRVAKDDAKALALMASTCARGFSGACVQRGVWLRSVDPAEAVASFMRGCVMEVPEAYLGCAMWFEDVNEKRYEPPQPDLVRGLRRICGLEQKGDLRPGSTILAGEIRAHYEGGACGRLKDLGVAE
jgi:hypothetical protein